MITYFFNIPSLFAGFMHPSLVLCPINETFMVIVFFHQTCSQIRVCAKTEENEGVSDSDRLGLEDAV